MAFEGEMSSTPIIIGAIVAAPVWIPAIAAYGAYHGIKAAIVHGIVPGAKRLAKASSKI